MSQAKVDHYKEQKANRKQIMKKEKIKKVTNTVLAVVIAAGLLGWIGYSTYATNQANEETVRTSVSVDTTSVTDYLNSLVQE